MAETIGSLVDKISIVELKMYHMQEFIERRDLPPEKKMGSLPKYNALCGQRQDLIGELDALLNNPPKPFRQFKMYNDPQYRSTT